jgi:Predicted deacylase
MTMTRMNIVKAVLACLFVACIAFGGAEMRRLRTYKESLVEGPGVTGTAHLSDYFSGLKGSWGDSALYFLDSGKPGATVLLLGGTHPNEPSGIVAAFALVENAKVEAGRIIVIPHYNRSGSTATQPMGGYPQFFSIKTSWGEQKFRMGDRLCNPLDQWPDPEVYIHYPSKQMLSNVDVRNVNRTWPGRPDGGLAEKVGYAAMQLIKKEKVDWVVDFHGAELLYPVTNCIVAPEQSASIAQLAAIDLTSSIFEVHVEPSPAGFRGISHREIADHSTALPFLLESPDPFLDQPTGPKTQALELDGKDEFLLAAAKRGLLFTDYDESGKSMEQRAGRHITITQQLANQWNAMYPDKPLSFTCPGYAEFTAQGLGAFFRDPASAPAGTVSLE